MRDRNAEYNVPMPRFTLKALFVVVTLLAVALGWLGWQVRVVQQRRAFLDELPQRHGSYIPLLLWSPFSAGEMESRGPPPSAVRRWIGDEAIALIVLRDDAGATDIQRI